MYEFNGLKYVVTNNNYYRIIYDKKIPESLVKFYSTSQYSLDAFLKGYLYIPHVCEFNDSLEASPMMLDFKNLDKETYKKWYNKGFKGDKPLSYEEDKKDNFNMFRNLYRLFVSWIGSVCFTTEDNIDNTLMWSHYSTHEGFVVQFNRKKLLKHISNENKLNIDLYPINYVKELIPIDPMNLKYGAHYGALLYMTSTKLDDWSYEHEWRLRCTPKNGGYFNVPETLNTEKIENGVERKLRYTEECIERIIIGEKFFNHKNVNAKEYRNQDNSLKFNLNMDARNANFINFVKLISEKYNDKLYISGSVLQSGKIVRIYQQIKLIKKADNVYMALSTILCKR